MQSPFNSLGPGVILGSLTLYKFETDGYIRIPGTLFGLEVVYRRPVAYNSNSVPAIVWRNLKQNSPSSNVEFCWAFADF